MDNIKLTRELIEAGGIDAIVARDAPAMRILSEAERAESLGAILAAKPHDDVWLFGYGSLIWNPTVHFVERRIARIEGWHRSFCLSALVGRGSVANPGLLLGLVKAAGAPVLRSGLMARWSRPSLRRYGSARCCRVLTGRAGLTCSMKEARASALRSRLRLIATAITTPAV